MKIEVIRDLDGFNALAEQWNHLHQDSASAEPFLRHEYLAAWWQTLGGGEWPRGALYVVTGRQADGSLVGIAPLFFTENKDGLPALMLLGSIEISDYLDFIVPAEKLPEVAAGLLDLLASPQAPEYQGCIETSKPP